MKHILIGFFILFSVANVTAQEIIKERAFTNEFLTRLQTIYPEGEFEVIDSLGILGVVDEREIKHYLDNAYLDYKAAPEEMESIIERYINNSRVLYEEEIADGIDANRIVPMIKSVDYLDGVKEMTGAKELDSQIVYEYYNEALVIVYAEDSPENLAYFGPKAFQELGINRDTLLGFAKNNLWKVIPDVQLYGEEGVYMLTAGGDFEACLIMMDGLWTKENFPVKGDLVVAIPTRDMLLITGSEDSEGLTILQEMVDESYNSGGHNISDRLFVLKGERFVVFEP